MTNEATVRGLLGLSRRAGQLVLGADLALKAAKSGKAAFLLADAGASDNTRKKLSDTSAYYRIPLYVLPEGLLDLAGGTSGRMAAALIRGSLAQQLEKALKTD